MNKTISVIMPVYNVAAYLPQALDSVLSQDYQDLEVIVIDDGSTDGSGTICDAYAAKDSRVKVIHQKNSGAAAAKNAGLRIAGGYYLNFVDSDDYLEPDVYGYMVKVLEETGADAAQFSFRDVYRNRTEDHILLSGRTVVDGREYLARFPKDWSCALLWNKLYKRSLYEGVFFEEGHKIDDEYFTYRGFLGNCTVALDERVIYNYRKRASSVMASPAAAEQRILDSLDAIVKRRTRVLQVYPDLRRLLDETYLDALWYLSETPGTTEKTIDLLKEHLKKYMTTRGNTFPPRYYWGLLWRLYRTDTGELVRRCAEKQKPAGQDEYFA